MQLVGFTIRNYRSVTKAHKLRLGAFSVLVGPNNEGKSNILRALVTAMAILERHARRPIFGVSPSAPAAAVTGSARINSRLIREHYEWERDYPIRLQAAQPAGRSEFTLDFELSLDEVKQFKSKLGSSLNGTLPISIAVNDTDAQIKVVKRGKGGASLTKKSAQIAHFVSERIGLQYIPAVRTAKTAMEVVEEMVYAELAPLERLPEYQTALAKIESLQAPILESIAGRIKDTLSAFLPRVTAVSVAPRHSLTRVGSRRAVDVEVDDGTPTLLEHKGDGVQSVAALALMRHAQQDSSARDWIVAIEEPESHLHPGAIQALKAVIADVASANQVVIATHCPLFVDRANPGANILVAQNQAKPAKSIDDVRKALGVRAADNLRHAELVLVVEGECDSKILHAILAHSSPSLRSALAEHVLAIDVLGGAGKLDYKLGLLRDALCRYHCFLDDDDSGRSGAEAARIAGLLARNEVTFSTCHGMKNGELEDLLDPKFYQDMIKAKYGVSCNLSRDKSSNKWSSRMQSAFKGQGRQWDDRVELEVKLAIADLVAASPSEALLQPRRGPIDSLVSVLEDRIRTPSGS